MDKLAVRLLLICSRITYLSGKYTSGTIRCGVAILNAQAVLTSPVPMMTTLITVHLLVNASPPMALKFGVTCQASLPSSWQPVCQAWRFLSAPLPSLALATSELDQLKTPLKSKLVTHLDLPHNKSKLKPKQ